MAGIPFAPNSGEPMRASGDGRDHAMAGVARCRRSSDGRRRTIRVAMAGLENFSERRWQATRDEAMAGISMPCQRWQGVVGQVGGARREDDGRMTLKRDGRKAESSQRWQVEPER
jgi:hypothetical protein